MLNLLKMMPFIVLLAVSNAMAAVNVAVIAPRAGEFAVFGDELVEGVRIAVDDLNGQGGVNGQKVNLLVVDDQCDDQLAVSTAQMLAVAKEEKVKLVIGPYCHNRLGEVADIYARAGIMQIVTTSVDKGEAQIIQNGLIKLIGLAEEQGKIFYNYFNTNFADERVALVYNGNIRSQVETAARVQKEFADGEKASLLSSYNFLDYADMGDLAKEITRQNQIAYILGNSEQVAELAREIRDEDRNCAVFVNRYQAGSRYDDVLGDLANGSYLVALSSLKDNPDFTETLVQLRLKGAEPKGIGVYSYAATKLWATLSEQVKSFRYDVLASAVSKHRFKLPWGEVSFRQGNASVSAGYGIYRIDGGEYTQVY